MTTKARLNRLERVVKQRVDDEKPVKIIILDKSKPDYEAKKKEVEQAGDNEELIVIELIGGEKGQDDN